MSKKRGGVAVATLSTFCEIRRSRSQTAEIAAGVFMKLVLSRGWANMVLAGRSWGAVKGRHAGGRAMSLREYTLPAVC